ncbi:hypothetical protein WOSG25_020760 [Weissella oryzae SG25]|uniref:Diaminopimelate epimerase n=1 Tax=Weissella oryzae (strain DSM 25784 / JCM 18191 / LMG 30913 / SG25) TaxID=1329250 RepID=A0A069CS84_WEIOS|nr:hypothetical protein [Weissella oryzae]GAK30279.1 hypothetical protein WOSG25_020760 [Weissella oryzae SG25]
MISNKNLTYAIYHPAGNATALVDDLILDASQRQQINDLILAKHPEVEQVGFLASKTAPQLLMAGGEFCGNATRSAAFAYLDGRPGKMALKVYDGLQTVQAGVNEAGAWSEIPLLTGNEPVMPLANGYYLVRLAGITHLVVPVTTKPTGLKEQALALIKEYQVDDPDCVGVIFVDYQLNAIYPVVLVKAIQTIFAETACGSGTVAVALVSAFKNQRACALNLEQPSGESITAKVNATMTEASIIGPVSVLGHYTLTI